VLSASNKTEYKAIIDKLGPKLNAFINSTRAAQALAPREIMKAKFPISIFQFLISTFRERLRIFFIIFLFVRIGDL
jgi:hypothetical protein